MGNKKKKKSENRRKDGILGSLKFSLNGSEIIFLILTVFQFCKWKYANLNSAELGALYFYNLVVIALAAISHKTYSA